MSSKQAQKLRQSILKYNTEMLKLKDDIVYSEEANIRYNKLVVKKAICKKALEETKITFIERLLKKFSHNKEKKLICDYFKS